MQSLYQRPFFKNGIKLLIRFLFIKFVRAIWMLRASKGRKRSYVSIQ